MAIKNTLRHTQKQFWTGNIMLRFSLQHIFRSELETEHFHHAASQSKGCSSLRVTQLEENAFPSLYNQKWFCSGAQNLLPMTFGELKTKQNKQKDWDTDVIKLSTSKTYFLYPPPLDNCSNFSSSWVQIMFLPNRWEKLHGIDYITDV